MINRVLIRIKVVQLLYSYLLNQSEFKIAEAPTGASKDARYGYALYLDLLLLVLELSGYDVRPGRVGMNHPVTGAMSALSTNKMVRALLANDQMRTLMSRDNNGVSAFDDLLAPLLDKIMASAAYKSYVRRKEHSIKDDAQFWSVMMSTVLAKDPELFEKARANENFTNVGFERAFAMAEESLAGFTENRSLVIEARNALDHSFDKAYELYHSLLLLPVEITRLQELRLDNARHKFLPSPEDLNPPMRFVENRLVAKIASNPGMQAYVDEHKISWTDDDVLVRHLLDRILQSDIYAEYMAAPEATFADDCEFWRKVYKQIILPSVDLAETLEHKSIYWNDDLDIMGTFVVKTIKRIAAAGEDAAPVALLPMYKDEIDENFGPKLFAYAVDNSEDYRAMIKEFMSRTWEMERLAFMDVVILTVALAELLNFPEIPVPVTVNEYVEIANCYSTSKSGQFVNGMLSAIIRKLTDEGTLKK